MCLDVLRAARRESAAIDAIVAEMALARGADARLDRHAAMLATALRQPDTRERDARRIAGAIAVGLAAALLVRHAPAAIGDAYCASRLDDGYGGALGTLPAGVDLPAIVREK